MEMKLKLNIFTPPFSVFFLLFISISTTVVSSAATYQWHFCSNTSGNYTPLATYQVNINRVLFGQIRNRIQSFGFYTGTTGEGEDRVYGLGLCRGDVPPRSCATCIYNASADIIPRCLSRREAIMWYDECMVRYSSRSFIGKMETSPVHFISDTENVLVANTSEFADFVTRTMNELASEAASNTSEPMFSTNEAVYANTRLFGLAECTRDISRNDCRRCLQTAVDSLPSCCRGNDGASVIMPSCYLRYETYKFYYDQEIGAQAPSPLPPQFGNPSGTDNHVFLYFFLGSVLSIIHLIFFSSKILRETGKLSSWLDLTCLVAIHTTKSVSSKK